MVHTHKHYFHTLALVFALAACGDDKPRDLDALDAAVDVDSSRPGDDFDAGSCDPGFFEQELDASAENIANALEQDCFNTGPGRQALVFEALCRHDAMCEVHHEKECRGEYEAQWTQRQRPRGISVPCMDALLDAMSCVAQASCDDAHACDAASERAQTVCDPNTPTGPMCPPLPEDREPTKGPIPEDAITDAGMYDLSRIPDFIPALNHDGEIAGYVRFCARAGGGAVPVYADDLKTIVGYMIPNRGFVPGDLP